VESVTELNSGENHPAYGYEHDDEYLQGLSEERKGEGNPMYGKSGSENPFYDKTHSEKRIESMLSSRRDFSGKNNPNYKHGEYLPKECVYCGSQYQPTIKNQKYCTNSCAGKDSRYNWQQQFCPRCGEPFTPKKDGRVYCDRECANNAMKTPRSASLYVAVRNQLLEGTWHTHRESHKDDQCLKCGAEENLELHHIIPVLAGGLNEEWNYMTLCKSCHSTVEAYTNSIVTRFLDLIQY
jgi:5-methylcytosine-specific restriction endonuclease McrA